MIRNFKILASNNVYMGGGNYVAVYSVWLQDERRELYVNVDKEYTTISTVNHIAMTDCGLDMFDLEAVTVFVAENDKFADMKANDYFNIAYYCYLKWLDEYCDIDVCISLYSDYNPRSDKTVIYRYVTIHGELAMADIVGWCFGELTKEDTKLFADVGTVALFDFDEEE